MRLHLEAYNSVTRDLWLAARELTTCKFTEKQDGIILIIALWVVVIVSVVALSFAYQARLEVKMSGFGANHMRARWLAEAGVSQALVLLREDLLKDHEVLENDDLIDVDDKDKYLYDSYSEAWGSREDLLVVEKDDYYEENKGTFSVKIVDECGKINLNSKVANVQTLENLLITLNVPEDLQKAIAAAIVDWIDSDGEPSDGGDDQEFGDEESEAQYYNPDQDLDEIESIGADYVCKNADFDIVEELLMVKFVTPLIFYGEDLNNNRELDENERDGDISPPPDNEDGDLQIGLKDFVTVYGTGRVNINTAPREVIEALLYDQLGDDAENVAENIVEYRDGMDDEPGTRDDRPFRTLNNSDEDDFDISKVDGMDSAVLSAISGMIDVKSDTFTIISTGQYGGVKAVIHQTVKREFLEETNLISLNREDDEDDSDVLEDDPGDGSHEQVRFQTLAYSLE